MKPRNKKQHDVLLASGQLKPISVEQIKWAEQRILPGYYVNHRKTSWCLECGQSFKKEIGLVASIGGVDCPSCRLPLKKIEDYRAGATRAEYWAVIDRTKNYQVVRMLITYKHMKKGQPVKLFTDEVMQHFICENGSLISLSKKTNVFAGGCVDSWIHSSELELRNNSSAHQYRASFSPEIIYPKMKVLPMLRRNGFRSSFHGISPVTFFCQLLSNRRFETILKAKQYQLLRLGEQKISFYWSQIRLCIRHGYKVCTPSDWTDYIDLLNNFGKDTNNPHYVCPQNLRREHDRYVDKHIRSMREQKVKEQAERISAEDPLYMKAKGVYFGLCIQAGDLVIEPLKSVRQFIEAGEYLKHCLFANDYYKKEKSLILAAKLNEAYVETVEFDLGSMQVVQSRGFQNRATEYNALIVEAVNNNKNKIAKLARTG